MFRIPKFGVAATTDCRKLDHCGLREISIFRFQHRESRTTVGMHARVRTSDIEGVPSVVIGYTCSWNSTLPHESSRCWPTHQDQIGIMVPRPVLHVSVTTTWSIRRCGWLAPDPSPLSSYAQNPASNRSRVATIRSVTVSEGSPQTHYIL